LICVEHAHAYSPICTVSEKEPRRDGFAQNEVFCGPVQAHPTLFRPRIVGRARNLFLKAAGFNSRTVQKTG